VWESRSLPAPLQPQGRFLTETALRRFCARISVSAQLVAPRAAARVVERGGRSSIPARLALAAEGARVRRQLRSSLHRHGRGALLRQRCCNCAGGRYARLFPAAVGARSLRPLRQSRHSHGLRACSPPRMSNCSGGDVARRSQPRGLAGAARLAGAGAMGLASVCHWASPRSCS